MNARTAAPAFTVTAQCKGEDVYLDTEIYPAKELLTLHFEPVRHGEAEAERIAAMAKDDDTMTNVRIEPVT